MQMWIILCAALTACGTDSLIGVGPDPTTSAARAAQTDAIATWNVIALKTTAAGPFSPPREARAMAIVSAAVFDAVNSITQRYPAYAVRAVAARTASVEAAVCGAAYTVLVALYPAASAKLDSARDSVLAHMPGGRPRDEGLATGESVAAALLAIRARDHATDQMTYAPGTGMGVWMPTPPGFLNALEPRWGKVTPFFMDSGSQFRPAPPPALGSSTYVRDYVEIQRIGVAGSTERQPQQTEAARFWVATAAQLWNQVVRQVTVARRLDPADAAHAYLLLNLAGADATIAAWDAKFAYNQWRPVTAIRNLGDDGSSATNPDTVWTPLIATPPFPDYPAGHTAYGGAAEQVLTDILGETGTLLISSPSLGGLTHTYRSVREIADEVTNARVWGGVHWRTSSTTGRELGRVVGRHALARAPSRVN